MGGGVAEMRGGEVMGAEPRELGVNGGVTSVVGGVNGGVYTAGTGEAAAGSELEPPRGDKGLHSRGEGTWAPAGYKPGGTAISEMGAEPLRGAGGVEVAEEGVGEVSLRSRCESFFWGSGRSGMALRKPAGRNRELLCLRGMPDTSDSSRSCWDLKDAIFPLVRRPSQPSSKAVSIKESGSMLLGS